MRKFQSSELTNTVVEALKLAKQKIENDYGKKPAETVLWAKLVHLLSQIEKNHLDVRMVSRED